MPTSQENLSPFKLQFNVLHDNLRFWVKRAVKVFVEKINLTVPKFASSSHFKIPLRGAIGLSNLKQTEPWMYSLLQTLIGEKTDSVFIDVGANIGQTYIKLRKLYPQMRYLGFEPNPTCVGYLEKLIQVNQDHNSEIVPTALSDKPDLLKLYHSSSSASDATTLAGLRTETQHINHKFIAALQFDKLYSSLEVTGPSVIKIDVEGAELEVIKGMTRYIARNRPLIICEVLHADSESVIDFVHNRNQALKSQLDRLGYVIYQIRKNEQCQTVTLKPVKEFSEGVWDPAFSPQECNYVLAPEESRDLSPLE